MKERIVIGRDRIETKNEVVRVNQPGTQGVVIANPKLEEVEEKKIPMMPVGNNVLVELCEPTSKLYISNQCQYGWIRSIGYPIQDDTIFHPKGMTPDKDTNSRRIQVGDKVYLHHGEKSGIRLPENDKFMLVPIENITAIVVE